MNKYLRTMLPVVIALMLALSLTTVVGLAQDDDEPIAEDTAGEESTALMDEILVAEIVGTMILIVLGNGVVANVVLAKTKGNSSGWIVITAGWGFAVFVAVFMTGPYSGAHINPAVTIGLAVRDNVWDDVPAYLIGQMIGAFIGAVIVYLSYFQHYGAEEDQGAKLATFSTGAEIRNPLWNTITEAVGTFVLVFGVFLIVGGDTSISSVNALPVALLVFGIGLSLGGPTGYAINPARDLGPRIAHFVLPIPGKGSSDWGYSWIPVVGPILGAVIAGLLYNVLF
jgi:glycerol uptake facilitator protein